MSRVWLLVANLLWIPGLLAVAPAQSPDAPARDEPAQGRPPGLAAYAGAWSGSFTEFGRTAKRSYFFNADGVPMWRGAMMSRPGQVLAQVGRDRATLLQLSLNPKQVEFTLRFYYAITDANRVERFVFRPVPGRSDRLYFEHWDHRRGGPVLLFRTELTRD
jgi:hypothetical protein